MIEAGLEDELVIGGDRLDLLKHKHRALKRKRNVEEEDKKKKPLSPVNEEGSRFGNVFDMNLLQLILCVLYFTFYNERDMLYMWEIDCSTSAVE